MYPYLDQLHEMLIHLQLTQLLAH